MKQILIHRGTDRGYFDHEWLETHHSFSFADYYDPGKMGFGALRVINDDTIAPGEWFGMHPHRDMEIITVPLSGSLEHRDSMGNIGQIGRGKIQVMSAGTGVFHSEYNASATDPVTLLQIWIQTRDRGVTPRYEDYSYGEPGNNTFRQIISPNQDDDGSWIHQDAWISIGRFDTESAIVYTPHDSSNGAYAFVISGKTRIEWVDLSSRDAIGISGVSEISGVSLENSEILLIEVPMK